MTSNLPICRCRRISEALEPSGHLDRSPWNESEWIEGFVGNREQRGPVPAHRSPRVACRWDPEHLYVALVSAPSLVPVTKTERDDDIFIECAVELFLAAGHGFYEFEINPLGAVLDVYGPHEEQEADGQRPARWDAGSVLVRISEEGTEVEEVWRKPDLDSDLGGVILMEDWLYGFNRIGIEQGQLMCVRFGVGVVGYAHFTSERKRKGAITWAGGMLYGYDEGGEVWLANATPETFEIVGRFNLPEGKGQPWAHPVVSGGRLYVRHGDSLHAFHVRDR